MKALRFASLMLVTACVCSLSVADDGAINNKSMSKTIQVPEFDSGAVNAHLPEAEHAFTGMMGFYVPSQSASGLVSPIEYENVDGELKETLENAKPLVNVFIYGPAFGVEGTAFAHSFMDTYAAVSLDDGVTFKQTNLSGSATLSSFELQDHVATRNDPLPADHTILFGSKNNGAYHAPGYDYPFTYHCTECHGVALQGTAQAPACYSCHDSNKWEEETPDNIGPVVKSAIWKNGKVVGDGENAPSRGEVGIENGETGHELMTTTATLTGTFDFNSQPENVDDEQLPPCTVAGRAEDLLGPSTRVLDKDGVPVQECVGYADDVAIYPGGTYNVVHAVAGNKVLVAWPSRFCEQGQPAYSFAWSGDDSTIGGGDASKQETLLDKRADLVEYLGIDLSTDLYLTDLFGVGGKQGSIDFADEGYPQAGVVPFGCVWTARGVLLPGDDPRTTELEASHMVWTKAERLTSGRRDPNRIEVAGVAGAGFVLTWQEDPDGLRPGQGEGPGEGWSGAVAHDKTDVWYSFIPWAHFDTVEGPEDADDNGAFDPINIADHVLQDPDPEDGDDIGSGRPQVYVPFAVPMRLSNNEKCNADEYGPDATPAANKVFSYCNFDGTGFVAQTDSPTFEGASAYGLQDFCADTVSIPQGPQGALGDICVNEDRLPNIANTGSTRPRTSLQGYDTDADGKADRAWVIVAAEESKGLGRFAFYPDGSPCTEDPADPDCSADIGKNQWYFSFDMGEPATSATMLEPNGLVQNLVHQGNLLNQPELDWRTGDFYPVINTEDMWDFGEYNFDLYNTEIARRSSILVQPINKAVASENGLFVISSYKQGAMRQGGPADVMFRRIVDSKFKLTDQGIGENPYAFANMDCDDWLLGEGANPYYPGGLCGSPATNLSSVVPDTCIDTATDASIPCPTVTNGVGDTNPILQGYEQGEGNTMKVLTWHQCPSDGEAIANNSDFDPVTCEKDSNLLDQSWYNPLDVSKGHRGFIDGDFVMFLYAWSPTWRLNAKGNDRYDLYVRRSFDGGETWTTLPKNFEASNGLEYDGEGTVTCETYRSIETQVGGDDTASSEPRVCFEYGEGANEQARNVTQHERMRITTLDPRYSPTRASISTTCVVDLGLPDTVDAALWSCDDLSAIVSNSGNTDVRDPSRYFMVYETGDNTTSAVGEAEPLDLFYSRAEKFGDDYVVWAETDTTTADLTVCYPSDPHDEAVKVTEDIRVGSGFCNEFDRMNRAGDTHSSEASVAGNPDGSKMYGVWAQWVFENDDDYDSEVVDSDAQARRIWWIDDYISADCAWSLPGVALPDSCKASSEE